MDECVHRTPERFAHLRGSYPILESRMRETSHVRFGERGRETRRSQGRKVRLPYSTRSP